MKRDAKNITPAHSVTRHEWRTRVLGAAVIILLTALAYFPAMNGKYVWDDDSWTTGIPALLRDGRGLWIMWSDPTALQQYYPLTGTSFWIDYHLWGFWTVPQHIENLLLHITGALLFWELLRRLRLPGAWLAAAFFALHPLMVESVAWITERKNVLSMVLYLSTLLVYGRLARFWDEQTDARDANRPRYWMTYGAAFVLFVAALTAKATAFSLPAVILLICWWKRGRIRFRQDVLPTLPFFVVAIGYCKGTSYLESYHVGASGPDWDLSRLQRCLIAGRVFWFYIGKLVWPLNLCFLYPRWHVNPGVWWQWLFPISAVGVLVALWMARKRIGRGPLAAALFYVGTLFPALGFMNAYFMCYSFVCDHWAYLSSLGLFALAAATLTQMSRHWRSPAILRGTVPVLLGIFTVLVWRQCYTYADIHALWGDTLAKNPDAWLARNNLGVVYSSEGKNQEAMAEYEEAMRLDPNFAEVRNNLGVALKQQGKIAEGIEQFKAAVRLEPNFADAYYNWGLALELEGREEEAKEKYQQSVKIKPIFFDGHYNLGLTLLQLGEIPDAVEQLEQAAELDPDSAESRYYLGLALTQQNKFEEAIGQWQQALAITPDLPEAHLNWAIALEKLHRDAEAVEQYQEAIRNKPDFFDSHYRLGLVLTRLGRNREAITQFYAAVKLNPDSAEAHNNLAVNLWQTGQALQAKEQWETALKIRPDYPEALNGLAWLMSTVGPVQGGDPKRAVALAQRACELTGSGEPGYLDTLAAAYAADGQFPRAVATAGKAIDLARARGESSLAGEIQGRLQMYQAGRAYTSSGAATQPN